MTAITGNVQNLIGQYIPDFTLTATPIQSFYQPGTGSFPALIPFGGCTFQSASGFLSALIPPTESTGQLVAFNAQYTANGVYSELFFQPVVIPNVVSIDISQLLILLPQC